MILDHFNYNEFKCDFYKRFDDLSVFDVGGVNYTKLILETLVVRYGNKGKIRTYPFYWFPNLFNLLRGFYFSLFKKSILQNFNFFISKYESANASILLIDNGRKVLTSKGECVSVYFHNLRDEFKEKKIDYFHFSEILSDAKYENEFGYAGYNDVFLGSISSSERKIINDLKKLFNRCNKLSLFDENELRHIAYGLTVFYNQFRFWNHCFCKQTPKAAFLLGHYHHEGLILACKLHNIHVIELQHGLISKEDIFYVMPEQFAKIRDKALFPDSIYTYGEYWSEVLRSGFEFGKNQIHTLGYYLFEEPSPSIEESNFLLKFINSRPVVLITTQPALHRYFLKYISNWINFINEKHLEVAIIVKLHPAEEQKWYDSLRLFDNVLVTRLRIELLFSFADLHVTSYSTTVYDSLRFGVKNISIDFPACREYINQMVKEGLTSKINENDFPEVKTSSQSKKINDFSSFFQTSNLKLLYEIIF